MKKCSKCGEEKPTSDFNSDSSKRDSLYSSCRNCDNNSRGISRNSNRERYNNYNLKRAWGITREQYENMLLNQGGKCAICNSATPGGRGRFHIDHDHATGKIRGLLCNHCNTGIGNLFDNISILHSAIGYLERHGNVG
jgi:hypothetical protein